MNKRRIILTLIAGFLAEGTSRIFPFLVIRYAQSKIGMEGFGYSQFGMGLLDFLVPFILFGYYHFGIVEIGKCKGDKLKISKIASKLLVLKLIHAFIIYAVFFGTILTTKIYIDYLPLLFATSFFIFTAAFDMEPVLFGTQKLRIFSIISIFAKTLSLVLILVFVESKEDIILYSVISMAGNSLISVGSLVYTLKLYSFSLPSSKDLISFFKKSLPFSLMTLLFYSSDRIDLFYVEHYFSQAETGLYAGAWKIVSSISALLMTIATVFFSEVVSIDCKENITKHVRISSWIIFSLIVPMSIGVWFVKGDLLAFIIGSSFRESGNIFAILTFGAFGFTLYQLFSYQVLLKHMQVAKISLSLFIGHAVIFLACVLVGKNFGPEGIAASVVCGKFAAGLLCAYFARNFILKFPIVEFLRVLAPSLLMGATLYMFRKENMWMILGIATISYGIFFPLFNKEAAYMIANKLLKKKSIAS